MGSMRRHHCHLVGTGPITVFNTGAERMFGYAAEEMIGRQTPAILHLEAELLRVRRS